MTRTLFALCAALTAAILLVLPVHTVRAHAIAGECPEGQHHPLNFGGCRTRAQVELYDWCASLGEGIRIYRGEPACFVNDTPNAKSVCESAGYRYDEDIGYSRPEPYCSHNNNSRCARINDNNAEYVLGPTSHSCQCKNGFAGDANAGNCAPTQCPYDQYRPVEADGRCGELSYPPAETPQICEYLNGETGSHPDVGPTCRIGRIYCGQYNGSAEIPRCFQATSDRIAECNNARRVASGDLQNLCGAECPADAIARGDECETCAAGNYQYGNVCYPAGIQCPNPDYPDDATLVGHNQCFSPNKNLLDEIRKTTPDLSVVVNLLNSGADSNFAVNGDSLLKIAVSLGHAEVMSALITAGANPNNARFRDGVGDFIYERDIAHFIAHNDNAGATPDPSPLNPRFPWAHAARMLYAFGNAVSIANADFNWNRLERDFDDVIARRAIEHLAMRHDGIPPLGTPVSDSEKPIVRAMAAYLKKQGAQCRSAFHYSDSTLCAYAGPSCPAGGNEYDCGDCAENPHRSADGNSCVSQCGLNQELSSDSIYPESACVCVAGHVEVDGECAEREAHFSALLLAEIMKDFGETPNANLAAEYLRGGADPNGTDEDGIPFLHIAVFGHHAEIAGLLLSAGANAAARRPLNGRTAAHAAAYADHAGEAEGKAPVLLTLARGAPDFDWNTKDDSGARPLDLLQASYDDITDASARRHLSRSAFHVAIRGGRCDSNSSGDLCELGSYGGVPWNLQVSLTGLPESPAVSWSWDYLADGGVEFFTLWRNGDAPPQGEAHCENYEFAEFAAADFDSAAEQGEYTSAGSLRGKNEYGHCFRAGVAAGVEVAGEYEYSRVIFADIYIQAPPIRMNAPTVFAGTNRAPIVEWVRLTSRVSERRGAVIIGYEVERRANGTATMQVTIFSENAERFVNLRGTESGTMYAYRVRALSAGEDAEDGEWSEWSNSIAIAERGAGEVCGLGELEDANESGRCRVIWGACGENSRGGDLYYRDDGSGRAVCGCPGSGEFQLGLDCVGEVGRLTESGDSDDELEDACELLGGVARGSGEGLLCLGLDASGTVCLLDSRESLPCEGLLKHVRSCNVLGRFALDAFLCGGLCSEGEYGLGGKCRTPLMIQ